MLSLLVDLPITTARERELRQACRCSLLLAVVTIAYGLFRSPDAGGNSGMFPSLWPVVVAAALYALLGCWLYRAHVAAWKDLERDHFRKCPDCAISLVPVPTGGTCVECNRHVTSDELRKRWHAVYRRHLKSTRPQLARLPEAFRRGAATGYRT